ncbi:MAG: hypothetical protein WD060_05375 [Pirellulales bacterium]
MPDNLSLTVLRADPLVFGDIEGHFVALQVGGKLFVAGLSVLLLSRVAGDLLLGRIGNPLRRIDDIGCVAKVDHELLRGVQILLRPLAERTLQREVSLGDGLRKLGLLFFELLVLLLDEGGLRGDRLATVGDDRVAIGDDVIASLVESMRTRASPFGDAIVSNVPSSSRLYQST